MSIRETCRTILLDEVIKALKKDGSWKVLLLDTMGLKVLSSCCSSVEILKENIALFEDLYANREPFRQFEAIYLIQPTIKSVEALISDFKEHQRLYSAAHVFFLYRVPDDIFDILCKSRCSRFIRTLKEINIGFLPLESQVFSLDDFETFALVYGSDELKFYDYCETLAEKISTLCSTLHEYPSIRYRRCSVACSKLAETLQAKLMEYASRFPNEMKMKKKSREKSQLVIVDRSIDCVSPLLHEFTLQAMVYEYLPVVDNIYQGTCNMIGEEVIGGDVALDESNTFWKEYRHHHIRDVYEKVQSELMKYKDDDVPSTNGPLDQESLRRLSTDIRNIIKHRLSRRYRDYRNMVNRCLNLHTKDSEELCMLEQPQVSRTSLTDIPRKTRSEPKYATSRWTPLLKDIMELIIDNEIDEKEYPFIGEESQSSRPSQSRCTHWKKNEVSQEVNRLIIFVLGGATYSEIKTAYEVTNDKLGWQVLLGSDSVVTPELFLQKLTHINSDNACHVNLGKS